MTKNIKTIFILSTLMFSLLIGVNNSSAATLATTLKGRILLQVEQNGEAWYVNPVNSLRYYLGRPADAFSVMRELGLGISNSDFDSFNGYAPSRLSGRILLKVADSGKAYYVNPNDLKMYYLGRPADAFSIMRELGLGITDKNLNLINRADNKYINTKLDLQFTLPNNYFVNSNDYGVTDPTKAENFFFKRKSENYIGVPSLAVSSALKLSTGQTLNQLVQSIYNMNKAKNYTIGDLRMNEETNYGGLAVYEFDLQTGYVNNLSDYGLSVSTKGKVMFMNYNGKVLEFMQTGSDVGLDAILSSVRFLELK